MESYSNYRLTSLGVAMHTKKIFFSLKFLSYKCRKCVNGCFQPTESLFAFQAIVIYLDCNMPSQ